MEKKLILITLLCVTVFSFGCTQKMNKMDAKQDMTTDKSMEMMDDKMMDTKTDGGSMKDTMK